MKHQKPYTAKERIVAIDILMHIRLVQRYGLPLATDLLERLTRHDSSKLSNQELTRFAEVKTRLGKLKYGTKEYNDSLTELKECLALHYKNVDNRHHPENHENGVDDMTLIDLTEMVVDQFSAFVSNSSDEFIIDSKRFGFSKQLAQVIANTVNAYLLPQISQSHGYVPIVVVDDEDTHSEEHTKPSLSTVK